MVRWHWARILLCGPRRLLARARDREGRCGAGYLLDMERNEEVVCCSGARFSWRACPRVGMAWGLGTRERGAKGLVRPRGDIGIKWRSNGGKTLFKTVSYGLEFKPAYQVFD